MIASYAEPKTPALQAQMISNQEDSSSSQAALKVSKEVPQPSVPAPAAFTRWHLLTISLLVLGYSGYYFCRSDLSVVLPLLIRDLGQHGIPADVAQVRLGFIASAGVLAYALGKFVSGSLADLFGGRNNFLGGMAGAVVFTMLFALGGGFPIFTLAWMGNRLFQSSGWVGLVKVSSRWFSYSIYGTVMAVLSLSYLFGDAAAREIMALLLRAGVGWRGIFFTGAGLLTLLLIANFVLLRETPQERGLPAPVTNPLNVYAAQELKDGPKDSSGSTGLD
jgi:OPA family glycerol-3-phosphate transporter-like MFS transporter